MKAIISFLLCLLPVFAWAQGISEPNTSGVSNPTAGITCPNGVVGCGTTPVIGIWAPKQGKQNAAGSGLTCAVTLTSAVTNNDVVTGYFFYTTSSTNVVSGIADDKSNAYTIADFNGAGGFGFAIFWSNGRITNGPSTVTVTATVSQGAFWCGVDEFSFSTGTPAVDGHNSSNSSANTSSGTFTTGSNGDLVYSAVVSSGVVTAGTNFNLLEGTGTGFASEYLIQATASASTAGTWSGTAGSTTISAFALK